MREPKDQQENPCAEVVQENDVADYGPSGELPVVRFRWEGWGLDDEED